MKKLISIFWNKRLHIIVISMVAVIIGAIYSFYFITPKYKSSTTIAFVKAEGNEETKTITSTDLELIKNMIGTYIELIESKPVLRTTINNLQLNETEDTLRKKTDVYQVDNTVMIRIDVKDENPVEAMKTANELAKVFSEKSKDMFGCNAYVLEEAEESITTCNVDHVRDIAIFLLVGFVISIIYALVASLFDVTVKSVEDIENGTELTTLVSFPFVNDSKQKGGTL